MTTPLNFASVQSYNTYAPQPTATIFSATLTNGVAASITLPTSSKRWVVTFSYKPGNSVFVDFTGATAAQPAGATFAATTSELNPGARLVKSTQEDNETAATISLLTNNATTDVTVALYAYE